MKSHRRGSRPLVVRFVLPSWAYPLAGMGAVVIGLLPWLLTGMRLPWEHLWAAAGMPPESPVMLIPLNQYYLMTVAVMVIPAGALAGTVARGAPPELRRRSGDLTALGLVVAVAAAGVQSGLAYAGVGAGEGVGVDLVLLLAWLVVCGTGAVVILMFLARSTRAGASVGAAIAAPGVGGWISAVMAPGMVTSSALVSSGDLRWMPAVLVGVALAWCGLRSFGRFAAWALSLVMLWVVPAVLIGIGAAAGHATATGLLDRIGAALDVLGYSLRPEIAGPPLIVAAGLGVLGTVVLLLVEKFRKAPAAGVTSVPGPPSRADPKPAPTYGG